MKYISWQIFNPIRSRGGGGNIAPQTFGRLLSKNWKSQSPESFWLFLNMYLLWLQRRRKIVMWTLTGLLRGVLNRPVKIFRAYFVHIYIFYDVLFRFYHVRCLNILKFGHRFYFWDRKKIWCILTDMLFSRSILTIFDRTF